jgi:uncharacterized protein YbcI
MVEANTKQVRALQRQQHASTNSKMWGVLGHEFLALWQQAHGAPEGSVSVMTIQNGLIVFMENVFSQAELALARQTDNRLRQYIDSLAQQMKPLLASRVEQVVGRSFSAISITSNMEQNWLMILLKFEFDNPANNE